MEDGILLIFLLRTVHFFVVHTYMYTHMYVQLLCTVAHVQHCTHVYTCIMYVCTVSYRLGI
jgi:hypothetical protein